MENIFKTAETPENKPAGIPSQDKDRNDEIRVFRHSIAKYQYDETRVNSEDPERKVDFSEQWFYEDLTPEGIKLAEQKAKEYFDTLDPKKDALFFVSSDLVRAAQTARIFLDEARSRGFEIIKPRDTKISPEFKADDESSYRNKAEEIGEGYIRKINCLTLDHLENMMREKVFYQTDYMDVIPHADKVSEETREKWKQARAIIEADNRGSWGGNYAAHSEEIAQIFTNVKSAKDIYETKFKNMIRLAQFADKKIKEEDPEKNIKVLGFSHENSFIYFLNHNFGETIKNCESVAFHISEETRGDESELITRVSSKGRSVEVNSNKI